MTTARANPNIILTPSLRIQAGGTSSSWEITQSTKPTLRPDGTALVEGDTWIETTTGIRWQWKASIASWMMMGNPYVWELAINPFGGISSSAGREYPYQAGYKYFIETARASLYVVTANDAASYWVSRFGRVTYPQTSINITTTLSTQGLAIDTRHMFSETLNLLIDPAAITNFYCFRQTFDKVGTTVGNCRGEIATTYRLVKP